MLVRACLVLKALREIRLLRQPVSRIEIAYLATAAAMAALGMAFWTA